VKNTGLAVARALLPDHADETANRQISTADFMTDLSSLVEGLEKETGGKFEVDRKISEPFLKELRANYDAGDASAAGQLLAITVVSDVDVEYEFDKEQVIWNEKLGLPKTTLEEVIKDAIAMAPEH
jgi:hypothetical protein